ncbi:MAG: PmoA family protein [Planctomycetes bacterium]|nr:PmoA family protein [Planctomycetota bacterium]
MGSNIQAFFGRSTMGRRCTIVLLVGVFSLACLPARGQQPIKVVSDESVVSFTSGERPIAEYQFQPKPRKSYFGKLFSPGGANVLRDAPSDHLHHHGLMFAVAVDGVDFWSENEKCGHEKHVGLADVGETTHGGLSWGTFTQDVDWLGPDAKTVCLRESRTVYCSAIPDGGPTLAVWQARLEAPPGKPPVTLSGSTYFGLGMRFVESMDTGGRFQNADGKAGVDGTNDKRSAWCAYSADADGKPVTVAMFDDPENPRHPATWFTMDSHFAYLAATLNLSKEPLAIESAEPITLRYAVAVWDGQVEPEKIGKLYGQLVEWASDAEEP